MAAILELQLVEPLPQRVQVSLDERLARRDGSQPPDDRPRIGFSELA